MQTNSSALPWCAQALRQGQEQRHALDTEKDESVSLESKKQNLMQHLQCLKTSNIDLDNLNGIYLAVDTYATLEERQQLSEVLMQEGGAEIIMRVLLYLSSEGRHIPDSSLRRMEMALWILQRYTCVHAPIRRRLVECGAVKYLMKLLKQLRLEARSTNADMRYIVRSTLGTLANICLNLEFKTCFRQENAMDEIVAYTKQGDKVCKLDSLAVLSRITNEDEVYLISESIGAINVLVEVLNVPTYNDYTRFEGKVFYTHKLFANFTFICIAGGVHKKTIEASALSGHSLKIVADEQEESSDP
ncbi:uncharacterized protein LOC144937551 [Lampetra fluviatilis]